MDQYSIQILGNNNSTSIEFVEKNYKLDAGETLIGQDDDFPVKKNLSYLTDWETTEGEITPLKPSTVEANRTINLTSWLETVFPENPEENRPDKGLTIEIEFLFFMNHWATDQQKPTPVNYHISLTANALIRFNVLRTNTSKFYQSPFKLVSASGKWVEYGFNVNTPYYSILDSGNLLPDIANSPTSGQCFEISSINDQSYVKLAIKNNLQINSELNSQPDYEAKVFWKARAIQYDQDDHTYEVVTWNENE